MSSANQEIDNQAADWAARRDLREQSVEEEAKFEAWLAADSRHLGAYGRAEAVLCRLERLNRAASDPSENESPTSRIWNRRHAMMAGGAAASLLAVLGVAFRFGNNAQQEILATEIGQMKEIVLKDGSIVSLNTDTRIQVQFTKDARNIRILQGEALFDVAKNKLRPFIVTAGDTQVRAVGTSFAVSMLPQRPVEVWVKEGVVELHRSDEALPMRKTIRAKANIKAVSQAGAPIVTVTVAEEKLARNLAWQSGRIALDDQPLEDAAKEFARYSEVRITVDPAVASKTVTGLFASNDPIGFAKAAAGVLKLQWEVRDNEVRIF
ncbi:MAG TPA: FecR domain-containing protein [Rhizomicrobium sp.]|nr:FecR domain-containing protein [Rhizomicrobium sp.]